MISECPKRKSRFDWQTALDMLGTQRTFRCRDVQKLLPAIKPVTVRSAIQRLVDEGRIERAGSCLERGGPETLYRVVANPVKREPRQRVKSLDDAMGKPGERLPIIDVLTPPLERFKVVARRRNQGIDREPRGWREAI